VTLTLAVVSGGSIDRAALAGRVADSLKVSEAEAQARIDELSAAHLLEAGDLPGSPAHVTDAGSELFGRIRAHVAEITARLWGDLPANDLDVAGRVLVTVLERANVELARANG
jgi:hypothetical protein